MRSLSNSNIVVCTLAVLGVGVGSLFGGDSVAQVGLSNDDLFKTLGGSN